MKIVVNKNRISNEEYDKLSENEKKIFMEITDSGGNLSVG